MDKIHKLTPNCAQNDQIYFLIMASQIYFRILKNKNLVFKRRILPILSTKSHLRTLLGHGNESRRGRKEEIQGFICQNIRLLETSMNAFSVEEQGYKEVKLRRTHSICLFTFD